MMEKTTVDATVLWRFSAVCSWVRGEFVAYGDEQGQFQKGWSAIFSQRNELQVF